MWRRVTKTGTVQVKLETVDEISESRYFIKFLENELHWSSTQTQRIPDLLKVMNFLGDDVESEGSVISRISIIICWSVNTLIWREQIWIVMSGCDYKASHYFPTIVWSFHVLSYLVPSLPLIMLIRNSLCLSRLPKRHTKEMSKPFRKCKDNLQISFKKKNK